MPHPSPGEYYEHRDAPLTLGYPDGDSCQRTVSSDVPRVSRFRLLIASVVLGAVVAALAIAFLAACEVVTRLALTQCAGYRPGGPAGETLLVPSAVGGTPRVWLLVPIAVLGGLASGWVTRRFAPEAAGSGSDIAIREYYDACGRVHARVAVVKILATALTIGTGGSGGREGPMIQVGAGMGSWLAGWFGLGAAGRRVLLAAGMGAAVAAVFRTPFGGTFFAAEVLNRSEEIESEVLIPAGTAAVTAHITAGAVLGWGPVLPASCAQFAAPLHFAAYALLALVLVVLARWYVLVHHRTSGWFARLPVPVAVKPALGAGLAAIIGVSLYSAVGRDEHALAVLGFGLGTLQQILIQPDNFAVGLLTALALGKIVTTMLTVESGGSGGVFGPTLIIGGCGGGALGLLLQPLGPQWIPPPTAFLLVGMAGFFAAAAKTPFSTMAIVCELTGGFGLIAPALGVCVGCFLLSGRDSLFDSQPVHRPVAPVQDSSGCPSK
jgi:chloride channel protein, CIC family